MVLTFLLIALTGGGGAEQAAHLPHTAIVGGGLADALTAGLPRRSGRREASRPERGCGRVPTVDERNQVSVTPVVPQLGDGFPPAPGQENR
jgi:hypothetical protein